MRNAYTQGKGELVWDTWPDHLVLRLSLQSENGPKTTCAEKWSAKAGPAGLATPPLTDPNSLHVFTTRIPDWY